MPPAGHIQGAKITHKQVRPTKTAAVRQHGCSRRAKDRLTMKMNKRFIASILRSARSETVTLPWVAARRFRGQARLQPMARKLG
ncbi:hypothetical protein AB838_12620 [Rhodobacteraceae bacterium (ex Bugula neritina AB1)]|nr:hypothetical protein AB838_12620 [Rhodobacteraceae bacterium (ex Bugula neritina AB1)]